MSTEYEPGYARYNANTKHGPVKLVCAHGALSSWNQTNAFSKQYYLGFRMSFKEYWVAISRPCEVCCAVPDGDRVGCVARHDYAKPLCGTNTIVLCYDCMLLGKRQSSDWLYGEVAKRYAPAAMAWSQTRFTRLPYKGPVSSANKPRCSPAGFHKAQARRVYTNSV